MRRSLVHGDAGPGNFLVANGQIAGLIDFEFAHIGDPTDDLAWLLMRAASAGFGFAELTAAYERAAGGSIDPKSLAYYRAADAADRADRATVLGPMTSDAEVVRAAWEAGASGDEGVLAYLVRRQRRENVLWQPVLASHLPPESRR